MNPKRISAVLLCAILIFIAGCGRGISDLDTEAYGQLALRFQPGQSGRYRVEVIKEDSVEFSGSLSEEVSLRDKHNRTEIDIRFTQTIESVDSAGNALAGIEIERVRYRYVYQNRVKTDFDSSDGLEDYPGAAEFAGSSYDIRLSPVGEVLEIKGIEQIRTRVREVYESDVSLRLVSDDFIKACHTIPALPDKGKAAEPGVQWSEKKVFDFGLMGKKGYKRIYTFRGIEESDENRIARVDMRAVPAEIGIGSGKNTPAGRFLDSFDNIQNYTGDLKFNLDTGDIITWCEELDNRWKIVDPSSANGGGSPDYIVMTALRKRCLEKLN